LFSQTCKVGGINATHKMTLSKLLGLRAKYCSSDSAIYIFGKLCWDLVVLKYALNILSVVRIRRPRGSVVVKALCYKPSGFQPHLALGFSQPLTKMSTRNINIIMFLGSKALRVRRTNNLTAICEPII
jgi:hypothetical protein